MSPDRLKYAIIKPLYQKGDKAPPANYRPTSIWTVFAKLCE